MYTPDASCCYVYFSCMEYGLWSMCGAPKFVILFVLLRDCIANDNAAPPRLNTTVYNNTKKVINNVDLRMVVQEAACITISASNPSSYSKEGVYAPPF